MAYDEGLAERVRIILKRRKGIAEKKMFGGLAFLCHGNMCCGINQSDLMLRLGEDGAQAALAEPHTREMDFTGRPMKSMLYVAAKGLKEDDTLRAWVMRALDFAKTLPPKEK